MAFLDFSPFLTRDLCLQIRSQYCHFNGIFCVRIRRFFFAFVFVGKNVSRLRMCLCVRGQMSYVRVPQFNRSEVYNYFCISAVSYMCRNLSLNIIRFGNPYFY